MAVTPSIAQNIETIREKIARAAERSGRSATDIALMAVSKMHNVSAIEAAYHAGLRLFGENRVQEAQDKFTGLGEFYRDMHVHLIGNLQRNKVKKAVEVFSCIQSVDSIELLREIYLRANTRSQPLRLLLELHTAEDSKQGFKNIDALKAAVDFFLHMNADGREDKVYITGLMTMAPFTTDTAAIRASFRQLRAAHEIIKVQYPMPAFNTLSMGMSNDYEIAIEEGATLVRIGTAIFGKAQSDEK